MNIITSSLQALVVDSTTTLASSMHSSQFCLPLSLRLLPLFVLALLKNMSNLNNYFVTFLFQNFFCVWLIRVTLIYGMSHISLQPAFILNAKVSMDARAQAMNIIKATPHDQLMLIVYPRLYAIHTLTDEVGMTTH